MMKFKTVVLCIKLLTCLIVQRSFANNKDVNFPTQFCLGRISHGFSSTESTEVSLNGNVYDLSVDYNSIDKFDILNIRKYLIK